MTNFVFAFRAEKSVNKRERESGDLHGMLSGVWSREEKSFMEQVDYREICRGLL